MEASEFQKTARDSAQVVHAAAMARLAEVALMANLDPELALKIVRETKDIAQALPKDKNDTYANLPVFHIHFGAGGVSGQLGAGSRGVTATDLGTPLEMVQDVFSMAAAVPLPAMVQIAAAGVNADVLDAAEPGDERYTPPPPDVWDAVDALGNLASA